MPLGESLLVFHVVADSLHRSEVTEIAILGKCSCKGAFTSIKQLRIRQSVIGICVSDKGCRRPRLHQLLAISSNLAIFVN